MFVKLKQRKSNKIIFNIKYIRSLANSRFLLTPRLAWLPFGVVCAPSSLLGEVILCFFENQ